MKLNIHAPHRLAAEAVGGRDEDVLAVSGLVVHKMVVLRDAKLVDNDLKGEARSWLSADKGWMKTHSRARGGVDGP